MAHLLKFTERGIYCPAGDFYIDPWLPVTRAFITHAHSDHARQGMGCYISSPITAALMRARISEDISVTALNYGEKLTINGVSVSLHPAGHIPGSAQIRIEKNGYVAVVSGDYKTEPDGLSIPIEPIRCHEFVSECTFGLPIFRWKPSEISIQEITDWWMTNQSQNKNSILIAYALGKAQRLLNDLAGDGRIVVHGSIYRMNEILKQVGLPIASCEKVSELNNRKKNKSLLVLAPPSAIGSTWIRRFSPFSLGIVSGWMAIRGIRRRRAADAGFVISDHADWDGLIQVIRCTGAEKVYLTHGYSDPFARYLREIGIQAEPVQSQFYGEGEDLETTDAKVDT